MKTKPTPRRRVDDLIFETWPKWKRVRLTLLEFFAALGFMSFLILMQTIEWGIFQ